MVLMYSEQCLHRHNIINAILKLFVRERGMEQEGERNTNLLPLAHTPTRTKPTTQACGLTGNQTHDFSVYRMMPNQLSHNGQDYTCFLNQLRL